VILALVEGFFEGFFVAKPEVGILAQQAAPEALRQPMFHVANHSSQAPAFSAKVQTISAKMRGSGWQKDLGRCIVI